MYLQKKYVNLIFAIISLLIITYFFIGVYTPNTRKIKVLERDVQELNTYFRDAQNVVNKGMKEPQSYEDLYKKKFDELANIFPDKLSREEIIVTIEKIAKELKIDISQFDISLNTGNNSNASNVIMNDFTQSTDEMLENAKKLAQSLPEEERNKYIETLMNDTSLYQQAMQNANTQMQTVGSDEINVNITIHGEYRSIIMFLFKLQNLEYKNSISNFALNYFETAKGDHPIAKEFPLEATFSITFHKNGGGN